MTLTPLPSPCHQDNMNNTCCVPRAQGGAKFMPKNCLSICINLQEKI